MNEVKALVLDIIKDYNLKDVYIYDERKTERENMKSIINYLMILEYEEGQQNPIC